MRDIVRGMSGGQRADAAAPRTPAKPDDGDDKAEAEAAADDDDEKAETADDNDDKAEAAADDDKAADDEKAEAEAADEAEAEAETADEDTETPDDVAEQEQEQLLSEAQARWYQRTWLRVLVVLAVLIGLAAVIPYPLRITSECALIPSERAKVRSELPGVLSEILVDEGQTVKRGDVIARIDDRALKAERLKVIAEIEKIEAELATLRKGRRPEEIQQQVAVLAARRNEVEFAAKEAERREGMASEGVGSRASAEQASRELEARRRAVAEAEAALRLLQAGSRPEEIAAQEAVLRRARAELAHVEERLAMAVVRAPIDGEILTPRFRERLHESVEAGGLVCEIANTRRMRAEIFVPQREVDVIELGMPVIVKVESYPMHPFEGKVDFIAPTVDDERGNLRVVVDLENDAGLLKANMAGYGEIEAGDRSLLDLATRRFLRWIRVRYLL